MKHEKALKLVAALRSGEYKQTTHSLHDNHGFCCLGVACAVQFKLWGRDPDGSYMDGRYEYDGATTSLPVSVQTAFGFTDRMGGVRSVIEIANGGIFTSLATANDGGAGFREIANFIEKNWEWL